MKWYNDGFSLSDELSDVDVPTVQQLLSTTYWASSRPQEKTERALSRSLCFSLKQESRQIGFARVLTDGAVYAIVLDVVIESQFQKRGLGKWLLSVIRCHPNLVSTVLILWTADQVDFYRACGLSHAAQFQVMRQIPGWMQENSGQPA
jgi:hypothetical protein